MGVERAAVSPDRQSVAWLTLYPVGFTTYPLPLKLALFNNGRLKGAFREPIWFWTFQNGGRTVAFEEETSHSSRGLHYELWDVVTGTRVAEYTPTYGLPSALRRQQLSGRTTWAAMTTWTESLFCAQAYARQHSWGPASRRRRVRSQPQRTRFIGSRAVGAKVDTDGAMNALMLS